MKYNSFLSSARIAAVLILPALSPLSAQTIIDDFSSSNAGNYNTFESYDGNNSQGSVPFTVSGGTFTSSNAAQITNGYIYNVNSFTFAEGDTVSLDFTLSNNADVFVGLSLSSTSTTFGVDAGLQRDPESGGYNSDQYRFLSPAGTGSNQTLGNQTGTSTLQLTKLSGDSWELAVGGGGISDTSTTFTQAGSTFYLGFSVYSGSTSSSTITIDNFQTTAVPEPSTYAMLALGFGALLALRRRARQNSKS